MLNASTATFLHRRRVHFISRIIVAKVLLVKMSATICRCFVIHFETRDVIANSITFRRISALDVRYVRSECTLHNYFIFEEVSGRHRNLFFCPLFLKKAP